MACMTTYRKSMSFTPKVQTLHLDALTIAILFAMSV